MVLVDTSVWIEFFHRKSQIDHAKIEELMGERRVVTCRPILAEILSGQMSMEIRRTISLAFSSMTYVDPDWNLSENWHRIAELSLEARKMGLGVPGIVDRMILLSVRESGAMLWTLDKKLQKLAKPLLFSDL